MLKGKKKKRIQLMLSITLLRNSPRGNYENKMTQNLFCENKMTQNLVCENKMTQNLFCENKKTPNP